MLRAVMSVALVIIGVLVGWGRGGGRGYKGSRDASNVRVEGTAAKAIALM